RIEALGFSIGDFPVRDWFWERVPACASQVQFVALMGMGFEAANLEHAPDFAARFRAVGDASGADVQERIAEEELPHVRFAVRWFQRWTGGCDFETWRAELPEPLSPMVLKGRRVDRAVRLRAGMPEDFIARLIAFEPRPPLATDRRRGRCSGARLGAQPGRGARARATRLRSLARGERPPAYLRRASHGIAWPRRRVRRQPRRGRLARARLVPDPPGARSALPGRGRARAAPGALRPEGGEPPALRLRARRGTARRHVRHDGRRGRRPARVPAAGLVVQARVWVRRARPAALAASDRSAPAGLHRALDRRRRVAPRAARRPHARARPARLSMARWANEARTSLRSAGWPARHLAWQSL